ncbi:threonine and homoserine efflux system [Clavibacter michiganensis subsp. michiganensis]|uniref:Threonine and homoserine efflux system n=1 Tax=Clavibacter michiganensis subsp. michiganensis TaxID=33013 RepID=A0A251XFW8_CLAMM|nr:threonine and homoserine efflux system [Clavibacter michiganensis subsp. michiganensis]OUE00948.1 threonine and homoserine efflux system [Clavibacter michiganensis subsp. michiganensis]
MTRAQLVPAVMLGLALSLMNLSYYAAVDRLGLGIAATIEFLGPLSIALLASAGCSTRRARSWRPRASSC